MHAPRTRKRSIAAATLAALALICSLLVATPAHALNDTGTGGVFVPATGRILDTKAGTGGFSTPMEAGQYRTIKVAGLAGLPDDGSVGAVSLNATVGASSGYGSLFGRPDADTGRTTMLIYNGVTGEYTSNSATVAVASDGTIQVMTETSARLILDVQGYYTTNTDGTAAGGFVPVAKRLVDTRSGTGAAKAAIAPGRSINVQITGANGVPAGASAAVVNLIAANSTDADGYLTPYATGGTKPQNSLHYAPSETTSVQAQVPLSADGKITIANSSTTTNLLVDLQGYFTAAGQGGAVFTPSYGRAYDSRASGNTALAKNETRSIQIAGTAGVPVMGSGITAVTLTLIVAHGGSTGYADVYADGKSDPGITAVNFQSDEIQTNTITVPLGSNGKIALRNAAEATNYVVDVQGWYTDLLAPTISCPAQYADGSWVEHLPAAPITCTISAPPAETSSDVLQYAVDTDDDTAPVTVDLSTTARTLATVNVQPSQGRHAIWAATESDLGDALQTQYSFDLGDWVNAGFVAQPSSGETTSLAPNLTVQLADAVALPNDAQITYSVSSDQAQSNVVWTGAGDDTDGVAPTGLQNGTYYWSATITGAIHPDGMQGTITTPVYSFMASDDAAGAGADTTTADDAADWSVSVGGTTVAGTPSTTTGAATLQARYAAVPACPSNAKPSQGVKEYPRKHWNGVVKGGHANLLCGTPGSTGYGMRHIWSGHGADFERIVDKYPLDISAAQFMIQSAGAVLDGPDNVTHRTSNDTFTYTAPIEITYRGRVYRTYEMVVAVGNKNWNIITVHP